jgi:hypothetical protein
VPPIGLVDMIDPATGRQREVHVTAETQRRFLAAAAKRREDRTTALRRAGADTIALSTDGDWLSTIANHLQHRRRQVVRPTLSLGY